MRIARSRPSSAGRLRWARGSRAEPGRDIEADGDGVNVRACTRSRRRRHCRRVGAALVESEAHADAGDGVLLRVSRADSVA